MRALMLQELEVQNIRKSLRWRIHPGRLSMSGLPRSSHALVTGGGRGIGREIAATIARAGATVTVLGRHRATLDDAIAAGAAHFPNLADPPAPPAINPPLPAAPAR